MMYTQNLELISELIMLFGLGLSFSEPGIGISTVIMLIGLILWIVSCG